MNLEIFTQMLETACNIKRQQADGVQIRASQLRYSQDVFLYAYNRDDQARQRLGLKPLPLSRPSGLAASIPASEPQPE